MLASFFGLYEQRRDLPAAKGTKGQIVRFLHDPDELAVIADSFDEYLEMLMDDEYDFITEETLEEE